MEKEPIVYTGILPEPIRLPMLHNPAIGGEQQFCYVDPRAISFIYKGTGHWNPKKGEEIPSDRLCTVLYFYNGHHLLIDADVEAVGELWKKSINLRTREEH
jgi:hypothetical protein